jgi:hypothetical protein
MTEIKKTVGRAAGGKKVITEAAVVEKVKEVQKVFKLPIGKLIAAPIRRVRKGTPVSHETSFKFKDATEKIRLPIYNVGGRRKYANPFSSAEQQTFLENLLGEDLNIYKAKNSFFDTFYVELGNSKEEFDLSDPTDYLSTLILSANLDLICINPADRLNKATYKWVLSEDGYQESEKDELGTRKIALFAFYDKIKDNKTELINFLNLRNLRPPSNAPEKWLRGKVFEEIEANPTQAFILITDADREVKSLFERAVQANVITYIKDQGYVLQGHSVPFASNKMKAIEFLKNNSNQETVLEIKAHVG